MSKLALLWVGLTLNLSYATIPKPSYIKKQLEGLKTESRRLDDSAMVLRARLNSLDKEQQRKNHLYVKSIGLKKKIESGLNEVQEKIKGNKDNLNNINSKIQKALLDLARMKMKKETKLEDLLAKRLMNQHLQKLVSQLSGIESYHRDLLSQFNQLNQRFSEYKRYEIELQDFLSVLQKRQLGAQKNLEMKKLAKLRLKGDLLSYRKQLKESERLSRQSGLLLKGHALLPVKDFYELTDEGSQGLTFRTTQRRPVFAIGSGKVSFSNTVATLGHVIVIDHGKEIRSVLVGDILSKIKANKFISQGEIIGYTKNKKVNSVYFEIRKRDQAQKTRHWLASNIKLMNKSK